MSFMNDYKGFISWQAVTVGTLTMAALVWTATRNYLLFHCLAEMFSVAIALATFFIAWNARRFMSNNYLLFMGVSYLFVAFLDVLHTLAYKGMGVFQGYGESNLPTQLWIVARYMESLALLLAPAFLRLRLSLRGALAAYAGATILILLALFHFRVFPVCFVDGAGLTQFKIISEYIICAFLAAAGMLLWRNRQHFDPDVLFLLALSILTTMASELCFTLYANPFAFSNELGHLFKVLSFFLMYRAIIVTGLQRPFDLVFRDLSKEIKERTRAEESLQTAHGILEAKVAERTRELTVANENLLREVGERKQAEQERVRINAALEVKNADLEQMIYVASHDLRSPLVNIDGYSKELGHAIGELGRTLAELPVAGGPLQRMTHLMEDDIFEALRFIQVSTAKMEALLAGLLRLSRSSREAVITETLDMNTLVSRIVDATEYKIKGAGITMEVMDLPPCRGDAVQVGQVFSNLLDNAMKYLDPARPGVIRISGRVEQERSVYCVEDNGIGIAPNHLDKIFQIFMRLDPSRGEGEGLGLTIVKRILARLNGDVWVDSTVGSGSRFHVALPTGRP